MPTVESTQHLSTCTGCWPNCEKTIEAGALPICDRHAAKVTIDYIHRESVAERLQLHLIAVEPEPEKVRRLAEIKAKVDADRSQVYYVRIHDRVKIGYTINMEQRLSALRVDRDAVLATEPGGRELEKRRHEQFAAERVGRREDFNPSRHLLAHIEAVKAEHGQPRITSYNQCHMRYEDD